MSKKEKRKIYKPQPISGFPEWLPEVRIIEQQWFDHIRRVFESYGFCSIETPSVEALDVLRAKGEVDKEIYVIERLHKEESDDSEARLALHFDQTVPFARYVAQHFNELVFPFKRYQMQRVWRGERPQAGRFREFYQCDIDVIGVDQLPLHFDAEMPAIIWDVLSGLKGMEKQSIQLRISNRKILIGYCEGLGIETVEDVIRSIDKLEKIGVDAVQKQLHEHGLNDEQAAAILEMAQIKTADPAVIRAFAVQAHKRYNITLEGVEELAFVMEQLAHLPKDAAVADLSIVRGLDYYTGTVYETVFTDDPTYGSICSGGRYDDLAGSYISRHLPGVGISIGFSRLFDRLRLEGVFETGAKSPAHVLVVLPREDLRALASQTAQTLRARGFNVEQYHAPQKLQKQLAYAEKKGIDYVWFPPFEDGQPHEIKNMKAGIQTPADPSAWVMEQE
jgi:histidyl-tRNA synthetase